MGKMRGSLLPISLLALILGFFLVFVPKEARAGDNGYIGTESCKSCHDGGMGLGKDLFNRKHYSIMGMEKSSLAEVVNVCITNPMGGEAIDPEGQDMQDLLAYMKQLTE